MAGKIRVMHFGVLNATNIEGTADQALRRGATVRRPLGDGNPDPVTAFTTSVNPSMAISTRAVSAALTATGTKGAHFINVRIFDAERNVSGKVAGTAVRHTLANAYVVPRTLNVSHGELATIGLEAIAFSATGVDPVLTDTAQTLPAGSGGVTTAWTIGGVYFNGSRIQDIQSISVNFGIIEGRLDVDSNLSSKTIVGLGFEPSISFVTHNTEEMAKAAAVALDGEDGIEIYLSPATATGPNRVGNTQYKISAASGVLTPDQVQGAIRSGVLTVHPVGGLVLAANQALPT